METLPSLVTYIPGLCQCHLHFIVSHCTNHPSFPLQWRLGLCGGSQSAGTNSLTHHLLWPNRGEGVFMAQSGPFSQSGATQDSLYGPYYKCPYMNTLRSTHAHPIVISHIFYLAKALKFCSYPLCFHCRPLYRPALWVAFLLLKLLM